MAINVIIIGAGLGGLALAQGLCAAGVRVAVYERDPHPFVRGQGYRIHLDGEADRVLRECLPPLVYRLYQGTSGLSGGLPLLMTEHLVIQGDPDYQRRYQKPVTDDAVVDRLTFRQALTAGLDGTIRYGKAFTRYEVLPDERVRAHFADGSSAEADLLVGADGAGSAVRRQLLPAASPFDSGLRLIYGKTPLTEARRRALPDPMVGGFAIIAAPHHRAMALGWQEFREDPNQTATRLGLDVEFPDTENYLMWGLTVRAEALPADLDPADGDALLSTAREHTATWHPTLRDIVSGVARASLAFLPLRTSLPGDRWSTGPVTLLGDAAHAMFPAGSGTLAALRDARELWNALRSTGDPTAVTDAVETYQHAMSGYARTYVRDSYHMAERLGGCPWPEN